MEGEEEAVSRVLPEDLVERIIAMMPYPSIFKALVLSKSWQAKFSPITRPSPSSSRPQARDKSAEERVSFQKQVTRWSKRKWQTFCPVCFGKEHFIAFDTTIQNWRVLPPLTYLPENLVMARSNLQLEGPLLYGYARPETRTRKKELYVANILTRSWKQLPPRPKAGFSTVLCSKLVLTGGFGESASEGEVESIMSSSYKLVMVIRDHDQMDRYWAQIYDSESDGWSSKKLPISSDFVRLTASQYFDGVLYMVPDDHPRDLLAFNVSEGTLEELKLPFTATLMVEAVSLVVCGGSLMMVVTDGFRDELNQQVFRVELEERSLVEVARGPPVHLYLGAIGTRPVSDGKSIYFGMEEGMQNRVLAYDVEVGEWISFPFLRSFSLSPSFYRYSERRYEWSGSVFQPGLMPFAAV